MSKIYFLLAGALLFSFPPPSFTRAQESSSRPENTAPPTSAAVFSNAPASDAPSASLRDLLAAACAHDESQFQKFLTARNAESFAHLAPAARIELMKRFVLLDGAGKPVLSANPSGRPNIHCTTADGAADIQLGGAELHDNVALLPVDIRDVSELGGGDPHHILLGMVRENSSWKILSIGMLFFDLPSLEVEWDQASIGGNERDALAAIKTIAAAIETYRRTYSRLPDTLGKLGQSPKPSADAASLLDVDLAAGRSNGYLFRMVIVGASDLGAPAQYELSATPAIYGRTGKLSFFRDAKGKIHAADHQGALGHTLDPVVD
ncbi:MAG TPA: hypothetical protein VGF20_16135 [Candidatus Acidoferrum sp.]|jgi:hypothetical protein